MRSRSACRWVSLSLAGSILLIAPPSPAGEQGPIVAMFDLQDKGGKLAEPLRSNLIDLLAARLAQAGYQVVPRDQIRERLREAQKDSYKPCYDQSCQIDLGRELAAQKTLATAVLPIADTCQFTAVLYDLQRATTDLAAMAEARCADEASLLAAVQQLAAQLEKPLLESRQATGSRVEELDRLLADTSRPAGQRLERAWELARQVAGDSMAGADVRQGVLERFLKAFSGDSPQREAARQLLGELAPGTLVVRTSPAGAWVSIDGKTAGQAPVVKELKAGSHKVAASLEGYAPAEREVSLQGGQQSELELELEPPPRHPFNVAGHATLWTGLALAAFGGVSTYMFVDTSDQYDHGDAPYSSVQTWNALQFVGYGLGGALMITGVVLWLLTPDDATWAKEWSAGQAAPPAPGLAPAPDGSGLVFTLQGGF
jgi:hypothetical protein